MQQNQTRLEDRVMTDVPLNTRQYQARLEGMQQCKARLEGMQQYKARLEGMQQYQTRP
jgi:hypothetical protein